MTLAVVLKAAAFAAEKHKNQRRKDAEASPYINHPIALANVLTTEGGVVDPDVLCAALLHDTIEDTETTAEELRRVFGESVTAIVLEVTDDKSLPKAERKRLQVEHAKHGACKNFCVNGHLAGNCRAPRSDDGRSKESSTQGVAGQPAG